MNKTKSVNVLGNEIIITIISVNNLEDKKKIIFTLDPTDSEKAWENHRADMVVAIKTYDQEHKRVVFNILIDERQVDLNDHDDVEYIKFKISDGLAIQFMQDYYMEEDVKDIKLSELSTAADKEGATFGDIKVALQMVIYEKLSEAFKERD